MASPAVSTSPFLDVLLSSNLMAATASYQDGLFFSLMPLISNYVRRRNQVGSYVRLDDAFNHLMADSFDSVMSTWLTDYGLHRLPKALECLPFLREIIPQYAAWSGHLMLLEWYHSMVVGLDALNGHCLVAIAIERNHLDVLELLLNRGYRETIRIDTMLLAIQRGRLPIVRFLHEQFGHVLGSAEDFTRLTRDAIATRDVELVDYTLDVIVPLLRERFLNSCHGAITLDDKWLVPVAAKSGQYDMTMHLLARGCNGSRLSLANAASGGNLQLVEHLHDVGGYPCTTSAMDEASTHGHLDVVCWLHVNCNQGCSPAAFNGAVRHGHVDIIEFLQAHYPHSIDPKQPRNELNCAAEDAMEHGHWNIVLYLLEHKLWNWTPRGVLDVAAAQGNVEVAQWLVENLATLGFELECTTDAMEDAAEKGHLAMLEWLDQYYPAVGCTSLAIDLAMGSGHMEVVQWLMAHGYVDGVHVDAMVQAIGDTNGLVSCPQDYLECLSFNLEESMIDAALHGHVKMLQWLLQSNTHVCACDVLRGVQRWDQDDLVTHILRTKASRCSKHGQA
ncbi:Aste57867_25374 [Aphanomyces stellatus]|uniref:Aste57867_25374 protein n=1 Tax=Aphanomyces stellatus TaxID=120398 RepID=A0A485LTM2_9STRA|nr:hypothetical protein As57867_025295 [Aphanomyces stellatus]VFU01999.1 Aste57867_25374 [Aphanomyces stellatus]